ncbi:MAG: helix-turn-helix domain-containing protein [Terriglobia bacterium]
MDDSFTFSETDLPAAIRGLREALGRSPEVMAKILGCSLPAYVKWEAGSLTPGGEWLIRLLQICPDEETRNGFRIRAERRTVARPRQETGLLRSSPLSSTERLRCLKEARDALDALAECGRSGSTSADVRLREFAENLQNAARYYLGEIK